jgi:hypothetical protein
MEVVIAICKRLLLRLLRNIIRSVMIICKSTIFKHLNAVILLVKF